MNKIVDLDPGHGGRDPGALGKTTQEKNNNLAIALKIGPKLQRHGVTVNYTRTTDVDFCNGAFNDDTDLQNRIAIAKQHNPNVFVSLHNNSFNQIATGIETHCYKACGTDEQLAESIQSQIASLPFVDRGIKVSNLYVTRKFDGTSTDACLVEYGFIDSEEDLILDNMGKAATLITKGILAHLGITYKEEEEDEVPLENVVVYFTGKDQSTAANYAAEFNCLMTCRDGAATTIPEAMAANRLFNIGGPRLGHHNEVYLSGEKAKHTAKIAADWLVENTK